MRRASPAVPSSSVRRVQQIQRQLHRPPTRKSGVPAVRTPCVHRNPRKEERPGCLERKGWLKRRGMGIDEPIVRRRPGLSGIAVVLGLRVGC